MTIKSTLEITDADLEAGIAQALAADNAATGQTRTAEEFVAAIATAACESFRGSAKRAAEVAFTKLDAAEVADIVPTITARYEAKVAAEQAAKEAEKAAEAEVVAEEVTKS